MSKELLSDLDIRHIQEIFMDKTMLNVILMDGEVARSITINGDGTIVIGRTKYTWWNRLIGDERTVSFETFALKVANALAGQAKNRNDNLFYSISKVVLDKAIADNNYHYVVDALFDAIRYGMDGETKSDFTKIPFKPIDLPKFKKTSTHVATQIGEVRLNSGDLLGIVEVKHSTIL